MDIQKIKELALANGFKLKEQASGNMDLHSYVYEFAQAVAVETINQAQLVFGQDGVTVFDTETLDSEISNISSEFEAEYFFDNNDADRLELLVAKAMKLGELYERQKWQQAQKVAVPETPKHQDGYYIRDLRNPIGNCMKFWYQGGYGTKHKNFFWCETLEEAKKYKGGCDWFEIWHAPYIDSLVEHTVDFQLADRNIGFVNLKAQEQVG